MKPVKMQTGQQWKVLVSSSTKYSGLAKRLKRISIEYKLLFTLMLFMVSRLLMIIGEILKQF